MELLKREKGRDLLNYVIAYGLLALTFVTAWAAMNQLRLSVFLVADTITRDPRWMRLLNMVTWIVFVIAVAMYALVVEHFYRDAVTQARIRSARKHPGMPEPHGGVFRSLRPYGLDLLAAAFIRFFLGTVVTLVVLFVVRAVLARVL